MADYKTINIDEIADQGAQVPDGVYTFRLKDVKGSDKKNMTIAEFEVVSGEFEGFASTKFFLLEKEDKGVVKPFNLGILDVKKTLAAIEKPLEAGYPFPLDGEAIAKILTKRFGNMKVVGEIKTTKNKKTGKEFSGLYITGPYIGGAAEEVEDFDDAYLDRDYEIV